MLGAFQATLRRDLLLCARRRVEIGNTLMFFIVVVSVTPLGVGANPDTLRAIAPGVIWVAALLATVMSLPRLFSSDFEDGSLDQLLLSTEPLPVIVLGNILAHWVVTGVPVTLIALVLGLMFDMNRDEIGTMVIALFLGTPALSLLGGIGAALTFSLRGSGLLVTLLVMPLFVPVLILGAGATSAVSAALPPMPYLLLLSALSLLAIVLTPWAIAAALRISNE